MPKGSAPLIAAAAAAIIVVFNTDTLPQQQRALLVRIEREQQSPVDPRLLPAIRVVQQLQTCAIVEISADLAPQLRDGGIHFDILDSDPAEKPYYLVYPPNPDEDELLTGMGSIRLIEKGIFLFWSDSEDVREILPPGYRIKRLPSPTGLALEIGISRSGPPEPRAQELYGAPLPDATIGQMVQEVSKDNLTGHILNLQNFGTRSASSEGCVSAGTYIYDFLVNLGLQTEHDPFNFGSGHSSQNIVATLPGKTSPESVVIVCAHYDSTSGQAATLAPGADDNASGTAVVLELARVLHTYSFDFTVTFIAFSAEEWGLWGSRHYAQKAKQSGAKILAVINLDMIAYADSVPEDLDIVANPASEWLADRLVASSGTYAPMDLFKRINASITASDHSPFWDQGYSALLAIEDAPPTNPHYHKLTDTLDTLNQDFLVASARASAAVIGDLAQPERTPAAPPTLDVRSQFHRSLFARFKTVKLTWEASRNPVVGYNVYRSVARRGDYRQIASSTGDRLYYLDRFLDPDASFFYVVTAVDYLGRESNFSIEAHEDADNNTR